jgi:hypothetical protein
MKRELVPGINSGFFDVPNEVVLSYSRTRHWLGQANLRSARFAKVDLRSPARSAPRDSISSENSMQGFSESVQRVQTGKDR